MTHYYFYYSSFLFPPPPLSFFPLLSLPYLSVSNALDEAATALNRMRSKQNNGDPVTSVSDTVQVNQQSTVDQVR